jgi:hypothetical protein
VLNVDGLRRVELGVAQSIVDELRAQRRDALLGKPVDRLDTHAGYLRLKVAGLLALLDERVDISVEDWELAGTLTTSSKAVRAWMQGTISADDQRRTYAANERAAERAARVETAKVAATADVARVGRVLGRHVHHKHTGDDPCTRRCLTQAVKSSDRDQFAAALEHAVAQGWVIEADGRYRPGESRPAE